MNRTLEDLHHFAVGFVREAGEEALAFYGKGRASLKFDEDLVTEAELHLSTMFRSRLASTFPEHQVFSADDLQTDYSHGENRYLWVFDPLDGVANFQAGIPIWGMSLALIENFWPLLGVFFMPATGDLFHARAGGDAFWGEHRIRISTANPIGDEGLVLTFSRFHHFYTASFPGKVRALGCTAAHICYVAMGRADAAVVANESFQGLAAPRVIIESAGGKIAKMDGGDFFLNEFLDGRKIEDHLIIAPPGQGSQLRRFIRKIA